MIDDVHTVVERAKQENSGLPVFLFGYSMGGLAVTRFNNGFAIPLDQPVDAYFPNELAAGACSDPAVVEAYVNDPLVAKEISFGLFYCLFAAVKWNMAHSSQFVDPVLLLHGCHDGLVSEKDSRDLFGDIASEDKSLINYALHYHEIFNEPSKDEVIGDAVA